MIIVAILIFCIFALSLNYIKIETLFLYKKIKHRKNIEFVKILSEWKSIRNGNSIKNDIKFIELYNEYYETIINTKIIKRYNKYFGLDEIPLFVYKYTAFKVKEKIDQNNEKINNKNRKEKKKQEDYFKKTYHNFYNNYYSNINTYKSIDNSKYYNILGVKVDDDLQTIKKKYREKMKQYHPDKLNFLSDIEKKKGEEESKKINEAYDYFCQIKK